MKTTEQLPLSEELAVLSKEREPETPATSTIQLLEAAVRGGITSENVAVVKEIIAMRREELTFQNKVAFNRAFFRLKQEISTMDFYADKQALTKSGDVAYEYCSERELAEKLEPVLFKYGFAMMFGQRTDADRIIAEITLVHEEGHEEKREYAVRTGSTNAMKDATAADTGSTTSAWRHLVIKLFGLKSRIKQQDGRTDARLMGEKITPDRVQYLREQVQETGSNEQRFLELAGVQKFEDITTGSYDVLVRALCRAAKARAK